jgi:hypothetical protein
MSSLFIDLCAFMPFWQLSIRRFHIKTIYAGNCWRSFIFYVTLSQSIRKQLKVIDMRRMIILLILVKFGSLIPVSVLANQFSLLAWSYTEEGFELPLNWKIPDEHFPTLEVFVNELSVLHNQRISVREARISTTMNVRPTVWSLLFRNRDNRKYVVRINNNEAFDGVLYQDVPMNARVGLWVHEMMHIKDFKSRSFFGVLERGWQYLSQRGRIRFEREIDQMVIDYGYRDYLFLWALFIMDESEASDSYKDYKRKIYLSPAEIMIELDEGGFMEDQIPMF